MLRLHLQFVFGAVAVVSTAALPVHAQSAGLCAASVPVVLRDVAAEIDRRFDQKFARQAARAFTRFAPIPQKPNPFDLNARRAPESETPVAGIIWFDGLGCIGSIPPDGGPLAFRITARVFAFHEGAGWSEPFRRGLVRHYTASMFEGQWDIRDVSDETSVILPSLALTPVSMAEVPPRDPNRKLPCISDEAWTDKGCAVPARSKSK